MQACRLGVFVVRCWASGGVESCGSGKKVRCSGEIKEKSDHEWRSDWHGKPWITWSLAAEYTVT